MRIKYNAPTTLTYAFFCTLVVAIDQFFLHGFTRAFFTVSGAPGFNLTNPLDYLRLFTHIAGHADWSHLISNMAYILLLGPMLEDAYGSATMFLMIMVTGFVTGVLNACFFTHPLLGASGAVFMMILLASFANSGKDEIPLTFILIMCLYLGREILDAFRGDDISQFAHLAGGLCGSLFGFFQPPRSARKAGKPAAVSRVQSARTFVSANAPRENDSSRVPPGRRPAGTPAKAPSGRAPTARDSRPPAATGRVPSGAKAGDGASRGKKATIKLPGDEPTEGRKPRSR